MIEIKETWNNFNRRQKNSTHQDQNKKVGEKTNDIIKKSDSNHLLFLRKDTTIRMFRVGKIF